MTEILMARDDKVLNKALNLSDVGDAATALTNLGGQGSDTDLTAIAALTTTGLMARTGAGAYSTRTLTAPAAGFTITDGDGVAGNPTFVLASDLSALEGLSTTGLAVRSATDTWLTRSIVVPAAGLGIANADGVAGNPTLSLTNDLSALEGLGTTGLAVRSAADTWLTRSIAVGSADLTVSNADGVAGNPTLDIGFTLTTAGKALIDDVTADAQIATMFGSGPPVPVGKGGTGVASVTDGGLLIGKGTAAFANTGLLAKGNIIIGDDVADPVLLTVGANDTVLTADSAEASGVKWEAGGKLAQVVYGEDVTARTTTDTSITFDDTIPQSGEGVEAFTTTITPTDAGNDLLIEVALQLAGSTAGMRVIAALFKDSDANALASATLDPGSTSATQSMVFRHKLSAGGVSLQTYKIRWAVSTGTASMNRTGGSADNLGDTIPSSITIWEVKP